MTLENMEQAWNSQRFETLHGEVEEVVRHMERTHRRERLVMAVCGLITLASTLVVGLALIRPRGPGMDDLWFMVGSQALAIIAVAWLASMRARRQRRFVRWGMPVREAAGAALRDIQGQIREMTFAAAAGCFLVALSGIAVNNLYHAGKMNAQAVMWLAALVLVIVTVNATVLTRRYRYTLRPQSARLGDILRQLEAGD